RDEVRPPETHPAARSASTTRPARRTGRVHVGGDRPEPQTDGEADHPPATIRRCPCSSGLGNKVSARSICRRIDVERTAHCQRRIGTAFCNTICQEQTSRIPWMLRVRPRVAVPTLTDLVLPSAPAPAAIAGRLS